MDQGLKDKVAIVTGASRGIGRACALALAEAGAKIIAVATSAERAEGTAQAARDLGVEAKAFGVDVGDAEAIEAFAKEAAGTFGGVDILVNNAGITKDGLFLRMNADAFDQVIGVNLRGPFLLTRALARPLMKRDSARVINIASVVGLHGNPGQANYAASKGGLVALTRSLAKELGSRGVTVNAVAPGFIETDMTAELPESARADMEGAITLGRLGRPEDVAHAVRFLAGDGGAWITGQVLVVDGGMRM